MRQRLFPDFNVMSSAVGIVKITAVGESSRPG